LYLFPQLHLELCLCIHNFSLQLILIGVLFEYISISSPLEIFAHMTNRLSA
jgi:accessory gene regulator protein AgrB